jgi:DNA polymerase III subunit delta
MSVRLLYGSNTFMIHATVKAAMAQFAKQHGEHSVVRRDGESLAISDLDTLLMGGTLFATAQLVVIYQPQSHKALWDALPEYLEKAAKDSEVLLVESAPDKRTRTYKWLAAHVECKECMPLSESAAVQWVQKWATAKSLSCSLAHAKTIVARVGTDQWLLHQQLTRLSLAGDQVTDDSIDQFVDRTPHATVFELIDAAAQGNSRVVTTILADITDHEDPYRFFGLLGSQVFSLAILASAGDRSSDQVAKEAGLHPFVAKKIMAVARTFAPDRMSKVVAHVAHTDQLLKSTGGDPWRLISACLHQIAASAR